MKLTTDPPPPLDPTVPEVVLAMMQIRAQVALLRQEARARCAPAMIAAIEALDRKRRYGSRLSKVAAVVLLTLLMIAAPAHPRQLSRRWCGAPVYRRHDRHVAGQAPRAPAVTLSEAILRTITDLKRESHLSWAGLSSVRRALLKLRDR
jgi:hypothetical protein